MFLTGTISQGNATVKKNRRTISGDERIKCEQIG